MYQNTPPELVRQRLEAQQCVAERHRLRRALRARRG